MLETINVIREAEQKAAQIVADALAESKQLKYDANVEGNDIVAGAGKKAEAKADEIIAGAGRRVEAKMAEEKENIKAQCDALERNVAPAVDKAADFVIEKLAGNL